MKFHENPSNWNGVVPLGRTDMTKKIVAFRNFVKRPIKDTVYFLKRHSINNTSCIIIISSSNSSIGGSSSNNNYLQ